MTKFLLLIALVGVVWWLWRKSLIAQSRSATRPPPVPNEAENMVKCAYCGVNQPISDSILADGRYYCCVAHRRVGASEEN